jgi:Tol biopolymer transport system component
VIIFFDVMRKLAFLGIVVALGVVLAGCVTVEQVPVVETGEPALEVGSVVFGGVDGNLYVATAGSDSLVRLTRRAGGENPRVVYSAYAWAGTKVVYATQEVSASGNVDTTVYGVTPGGNPERLLRKEGFAPFFLYPSPDGSRVAYLGSEAGSTQFFLGSVRLDGRREVEHGRGQPFYSAWSPDSRQLLTHVGLPGSTTGSYMQFQSVDGLEDGDPPPPPLAVRTGSFQAPAYSPDGTAIAVVTRDGGTNALALMSADGSEVAPLRILDGAAAIAWSPGGQRLAYIDGGPSPLGGIIGNLWVTEIATGEMRPVSGRATAFFWSPDNTRLIYLEPYLVGDAGGSVLLYRVGVYRTFDGSSEVLGSLRPTAEFVRQIVPFFDQYHRAYTIWSPDSRLVVLNGISDEGTPAIHLIDTERRRSGNEFSVAYRLPTQLSDAGGWFPADGVASRILALGTVPFFSMEDSGVPAADLASEAL